MNNKIISIMHVSDIHKSKAWDIKNENIINALINDFERYSKEENPIVKKPDFIVVSGDIIYGAIESDPDKAREKLGQEYEDSYNFLVELCSYFVEGNRERMILIPGNHDISWFHSYANMKKLEHENGQNSEFINNIWSHNNKTIRWSWKNHSYYEIRNDELYNERLLLFSEFYQKFYGNRNYSLRPEEQFDVFDYPEEGISIVGFNSCFLNDHLNLEGKINPACVANLSSKLRELKSKGRFLIATWHHNTKGLPIEANYMDSRVVKNLIDNGFSIGLHGHQHRSEIIDDYFRYGENRRMTVISAGTLNGGPDQLPTGEKRQYNIIELDLEDLKGRLHSREMMTSSSFDLPTWGPGRIIEGNCSSFIEFDIQASPNKLSSNRVLEEIIDLFKKKLYSDVIPLLLNQDIEDNNIRVMLIESLTELERYREIVKYFKVPINSKEAIYLFTSYEIIGDKEGLKNLMHTPFILESTDPSIRELKTKYQRYAGK